MRRPKIAAGGRALAAVPVLVLGLLAPWPAGAGAVLEVRDAVSGAVLDRVTLPPSGRWCLVWRHSVTGGGVADCLVQTAEGLMLDHSFLHGHAAGLGEVPGRGTPRPAPGGGYVIEGMATPLPAARLPLRVGSARVGHRITLGDRHGPVALDLTARHAGRRVHLGPPPPPARTP